MKKFEFDYENMPNLDDDSSENMENVDALMDAIGKYLEEEKKLIDIMLNSDEELTMEEYVEKYASDEYKAYLKMERERQDELRKQGIIV